MKRVLIVSKPVVPPFHDGSICLVHGLACALERIAATVLTTSEAASISQRVEVARVYTGRGQYAPALQDNARVLKHLLIGPRYDIWHFVFAPNLASSTAGALARKVRRIPVVQTVASQPRSFGNSCRLLFGDRVVALSRYTAERLVAQGFPASRIRVIPPPVGDVERTERQRIEARQRIGIPLQAPMFVYAGDLEFSRGAQTVAEATPRILKRIDGSVVVFACRTKTERSRGAVARLKQALSEYEDRVHFVGELPDLPALLASAVAAPFPVDDLYGKVDLPYAVIEACLLGVPIIVSARTPLEEIEGSIVIEPGNADALAVACVELARDASTRGCRGEEQRHHARARHDPSRVARAYEEVYEELLGSKP